MPVAYSSSMLCFPAMLFRYYLNDFDMVPVGPIISGIAFVITSHMRSSYVLRSWYFTISSASFFITFLYLEIAVSIDRNIHFPLSRILMSNYCYYYYYYYKW